MIGGVLLLCLCQTPQDPPAPGGGTDIIRLKVGTELCGTIVRETADYIEIMMAEGTVVGFDKSRTVSIARSASGSRQPDERPADLPRLRDRWSVLHDGAGRPVGWLHGTVTPGEDSDLRIGEEWRFYDDRRTTEVTMLEVVGQDGQPKSCFYHERVRAKGDQIRSEKVVRGVREGDQLVVTRRSTNGNSRQTYEFPDGMRFPLELQEQMRRQPIGLQARMTHLVFDPRVEQFVRRTYDVGRQRRVELDGKRTGVRVLTLESSEGVNSEWLDAASETVRREINGPALVAIPTTEQAAKRRAKDDVARFTPAFRQEPGGSFAMWLPNPMWRFVDGQSTGQITARAELDEASVSLVAFDQIDADTLVESASDTVLRWLSLVHRDLRVIDRTGVRICGTEGLRARGQYEVQEPGRSVLHRIRVDVFRFRGRVLALCCQAPHQLASLLEDDFDRILQGLELRREGFAPELQGPLKAPSAR